ncbi:hypothetical protein M7I_8202 [Glarea lozoyensis 74030]|uniref:Uncharacterized protein n=1 Tax=Glarea lozoyensis (strain ATCC 74030 / MF5533) TaxID=1104152 RepID=H0EZD7_GLAL7|nr:hypothetical protein M7I_8202 [Glarea lozoyensis 74030]
MDSESTPPENDPWTLAKNRFLAELDPEEVVIFNNATLENLYYGASNYEREDSRNSKARAVLNKLAPLISAIESYDPSNLFGSLTRQALEKLDVIPEELATAIEREHHNGEHNAASLGVGTTAQDRDAIDIKFYRH